MKAVAVAEDVIKLLGENPDSVRVRMRRCFFSTHYHPLRDEINRDLQDVLPQILESGCAVCALGAAMVSKARLYDNVPLKSLFNWAAPCWTVYRKTTTKLLEDVFSEHTLRKIECAFEVFCLFEEKSCYGATCFGAKYLDDRQRLIAIMNNIIDNGGDFVTEPASGEEVDLAMKEFSCILKLQCKPVSAIA